MLGKNDHVVQFIERWPPTGTSFWREREIERLPLIKKCMAYGNLILPLIYDVD
jgi:hypothetical protein